MKRFSKIIPLAIVCILLLPGLTFALTYNVNLFANPVSNPAVTGFQGAKVYSAYESGTWYYYVENWGFDPEGDGWDAISYLDIDLYDNSLTWALNTSAGDVGINNISILAPFVPDPFGFGADVIGTVRVKFDPNFLVDPTTDPVMTSAGWTFSSTYGNNVVNAIMGDTNETTPGETEGAMSAPGGGGNTVPEPATLLLLGTALVCLAGSRASRRK